MEDIGMVSPPSAPNQRSIAIIKPSSEQKEIGNV
jgi:hypothetical protein